MIRHAHSSPHSSCADDAYAPAKIRLLMALRRAGISDRRVLSAMEHTPREMFLPEEFRNRAYEDIALPIECDQTISQPYIVAYMTEQLQLHPRCRVLEIGTGSGYQCAVLSRLARRVHTIERHEALLRQAEQRFQRLGLTNITAICANGASGWPHEGVFDRILVTAAARSIALLLAQLGDGGILIAPLVVEADSFGDRLPDASDVQCLQKITRKGDSFKREDLLPVRFVPLVEAAVSGAACRDARPDPE